MQAANIGDSHYLRFDRTENSTILTVTDAESSILEPNSEWIGSSAVEIWPLHITRSAFKTPIMREGEVVGNHRSYHWKERWWFPMHETDETTTLIHFQEII